MIKKKPAANFLLKTFPKPPNSESVFKTSEIPGQLPLIGVRTQLVSLFPQCISFWFPPCINSGGHFRYRDIYMKVV